MQVIRDIQLIAFKEMLYASRDPDVLIYGLLVPLVVYPIMFIGAGEFAFWMVGQFESHNSRIAISYTDDARYATVKAALSNSKQFDVVESRNPREDLRANRIDALIQFDPIDKKRVTIKLPNANIVDKTGLVIYTNITAEQQRLRDEAAKKAGVSKADLEVFTGRYIDVAPSSSRREIVPVDKLGGLPIGWLAFVALIWIHVALCAAPPATIMFAEEREKKTLETTLLLPASRFTVVLGKFAATYAIALGSGLVYLVGIGVTFFALMLAAQLKSKHSVALAEFFPTQGISGDTWVIFAITILLSAAVCSACYLLATSRCNTFKEAQAIITLPILFFCFIPFMVFLPGLELNIFTSLVPVLNLFLTLKRGEPEMILTCLAIASMLAIIVASLHLSATSLRVRTPGVRVD